MAGQIRDEERVKRLARAIASDISIYNEAAIVKGIEEDSLWEVLSDQIEEGRTHFIEQVIPELQGKNYFNRALVDILLKNKSHVKSKIW